MSSCGHRRPRRHLATSASSTISSHHWDARFVDSSATQTGRHVGAAKIKCASGQLLLTARSRSILRLMSAHPAVSIRHARPGRNQNDALCGRRPFPGPAADVYFVNPALTICRRRAAVRARAKNLLKQSLEI
jgi:hypothetical protein